MSWEVRHGDVHTVLAELPALGVDAIVCDPPYGIDFCRERWDGADIRRAARADDLDLSEGQAFERWTTGWASLCLRALKPGAHLAAFGSPRTFHRLASGIEDAGFELRDTLLWLHAEGMPKSRQHKGGRGTALKPAFEPIVLARKPLEQSTAETIETFGTGALNIDATRIPDPDRPVCGGRRHPGRPAPAGRWPADVVFSHARGCTDERCADGCPVADLDAGSGDNRPSRFFFCAKAPRRERDAGCEQLAARTIALFPNAVGAKGPQPVRNVHPTVKPIALMRWLVRLVTPPEGLVLDPFCGSGTTGAAAVLERRRFTGIDCEEDYVQIARARIAHWSRIAATDEPRPKTPRRRPAGKRCRA